MAQRRCLPEGFTAEGLARTAASAASRAVRKAEAGSCDEAFDWVMQARALLTMAASSEDRFVRHGVGLAADKLVNDAKGAFRKRCLVRR